MQSVHISAQRDTESAPTPATTAPLVVVIDDSQTVQKIIETCLSREGMKVQSFRDGIEALRWLSESEKPIPDLILLDIGLPKLDGFQIARLLKAKSQYRRTILVMLTRQESMVARLKAQLLGVKGYITKPFRTQEVVELLKALLAAQHTKEYNRTSVERGTA